MFLFAVSERFYITDLGLILLPGFENNYVPVGTPITIIRPDKTKIETKITSVTFETNHITIEKSFSKDDVPIGSEVWANKSITYDLTYYNLLETTFSGIDLEIIFQHKVDHNYFTRLKLSEVADTIDDLKQNKTPARLRIEQTNSSYAAQLASQRKDHKIKYFQEALIFSDTSCLDIIFKCVAKEIKYQSERL
jgi:hypothetical protein